MSNITSLYPIRYTQDVSSRVVSGLVEFTDNSAVDLTYADQVTAINVETDPAVLPESVDVRFVFNTGSDWFRLNADGTSDNDINQTLSYESVFEEGNTVAELRAITSATALANTRVKAAIAIKTVDYDNVRPKVKLGYQCVTLSQQLVLEVLSPEYSYDGNVIITNIISDSYVEGGGGIVLEGRYIRELEDGGEEYTAWMSLPLMIGILTDRIQFRATASVNEIGTAVSILRSIKAEYNEGSLIAASSGVSTIITRIEDWRVDLRFCRILVRHSELDASYIKAYVTFRPKVYKIKGEVIGEGTGQRHNYELEHKDGIKLDTVRLYYDGAGVPEGYDVNCETGQIITTAPVGVTITCDYEYGWGDEQWQELELGSTEQYENFCQSVYRIKRSDSDDELKSIAGIGLDLHTVTGNAVNEFIGYGTGDVKIYKVRYPIRSGVLEITAGGVALSSEDYEIQQDTRYVKVNAGSGAELAASYEWESEGVKVYQVNGIFSE